MKRLITLSLFAAIIAVGAASCKSKQTCPAYGKVNQPQHTAVKTC